MCIRDRNEYRARFVVNAAGVACGEKMCIRDRSISNGVMLVDMNFSGIEQICKGVDLGENGYIYLIDRNGEIIYLSLIHI